MVKPYQSSTDYIIKSVEITGDNGVVINCANLIAQLEIFENLDRPFLTGKMMMRDDINFFDGIYFNGTERCKILLEQPISSGVSLELNFILRKVDAVRKTNDQTEVMSISLLEENAFNSQLRKISKSFSGSPDEIIEKLMTEIGQSVDMPAIKPAQSGSIKYLVPYLTAFQAADTVKNRTSTENGLPYFLFKTMSNKNIQFKSLEEMMTTPPWNQNKPYRYSKAFASQSLNLTQEEASYIVEQFSYAAKDDTMTLIEAGSVSAVVDMIDVTSGVKERFSYNAEEMFQKLYDANVLEAGYNPVISSSYKNGDLNLVNAPAKNISRIVMNSTYSDYKNLSQEETAGQFKLDFMRRAFKNLLFKNSITIRVPGVHYLQGVNRSIGTQIEFYYPNNNAAALEGLGSDRDLKDRKRSGKYVIYSARHLFVANKHTVDLTAVKLGNEK